MFHGIGGKPNKLKNWLMGMLMVGGWVTNGYYTAKSGQILSLKSSEYLQSHTLCLIYKAPAQTTYTQKLHFMI